MKVAYVTPYLPWPADTGGKLRSFHLLKGLACEAQIDLFTLFYGSQPDPGPLTRICHQVNLVPLIPAAGRWAKFRSLLTSLPRSVQFFQTPASLAYVASHLRQPYDLFICDEICMAPYILPHVKQGKLPGIVMRQKIDYLHYREMARARSWGEAKFLDWLEARRLQRFEQETMPYFQGAVVCSTADGQIALSMLSKAQPGHNIPIAVIPNGADMEYFTPQRRPDPDPTVLLMGTMHYLPNIDAVLYFFREMYTLLSQAVPNVKILIVGHNPPAGIVDLSNLPGVTVTGSVPDVRPYINRSWLLAVPLRLGGGTRLKIIEAMAAGLPVVSTSVGVEGITGTDGEHFLLADTPADFARKTALLLQNSDLQRTLAANAYDFAQQHYSWRRFGQDFAAFCHQILAESELSPEPELSPEQGSAGAGTETL
ncbi:MAG: glycosyltransferase [Chloroflexi bacterium]|nr:glycosyltransferase [Chloroflexota bacterium]